MSVCVVADYPLPSKHFIGGTSVGAIICCDTKITAPGRSFSILAAKRRAVSENVMVCYTSSNFFVTTAALNYSTNRRVCLKRLGGNLRAHHERWGGLTELLAVVWHKDQLSPQILELMPDRYEPVPRKGVVGIGDAGALLKFRELLSAHLESRTEIPQTPEAIEGLSKSIGRPISHDYGRGLLRGATEVACAMSDAIKEAGGPTVGLPLVVNIILPKLGVQNVEIPVMSLATSVWDSITPGSRPVVLPVNKPDRSPAWHGRRSAVQLLSW